MTGWSLSDGAATVAATARLNGKDIGVLVVGLPRPDIGSQYPHVWARTSGFAGVIDLRTAAPGPATLSVRVDDASGAAAETTREVSVEAAAEPASATSEFDTALLHWLNRAAWPGQQRPIVTRAAYQLRHMDPAARRIADVRSTGRIEYLLHLLQRWRIGGDDAFPGALLAGVWVAPPRNGAGSLPAGWRDSAWGRALLAWLQDDAGTPAPDEPLVPWFSLVMHEADPALQRAFPDPLGADRQRWSRWVYENAPRRYPDAAGLVASTAPSLIAGARQGPRLRLPDLRRNRHAEVDVAALLDAPSVVDDLPVLRATWPKRYTQRGVNVVGHYADNSGAAEATRATARSVRAAGWPMSTLDVGPRDAAVDDSEWRALGRGAPYGITVLHDNIAGAAELFRRVGPRFLLERSTVAYWYWEMSEVPEALRSSLRQVDEVWAASRFAAEAFGRHADVPVHVVPPSVDAHLTVRVARERFALPEDRFLFLAMASVHSAVARKNPYGVVEAFERAFDSAELRDTALVLKINGLELVPDLAEKIRESAAHLPIHCITESLSRQEVLGLIDSCDSLVSLHRGEGFGLPLAEAMALGKPVVATAYSGNMDFTDADTAFLVEYDIVPLDRDHGPYEAGMTWADPRLDSAAAQLRRVRFDTDAAARTAAAGQARIREGYGLQATAAAVGERLSQLNERAATLAHRR